MADIQREPTRHLVMVQGWGVANTVWDSMAPALAPQFNLRVIDPCAQGGSEVCAESGWERLVDEVAREAPGECAVCAWSLGALVALAWAHRAPHQVKRLVLIAATPCFVARADWPHGMGMVKFQRFRDAFVADPRATLRRFVALQAHGDLRAPAVARFLAQRMVFNGPAAHTSLVQGLEMLRDTDLRAKLAAITQPTLLVHGDRDALVPPAAAAYLQHALAHARLVVIPGAGHAPFLSCGERVSAALAGFLRES